MEFPVLLVEELPLSLTMKAVTTEGKETLGIKAGTRSVVGQRFPEIEKDATKGLLEVACCA
jgi:hypothetical protein